MKKLIQVVVLALVVFALGGCAVRDYMVQKNQTEMEKKNGCVVQPSGFCM